jgi:hypothetical protein
MDSATTFGQTFTLTFGDQAENDVRMQKLGKMADEGFSLNDLSTAKRWFELQGCACELYHLNKLYDGEAQDAYVLVVRRGVDPLLGEERGGGYTSDDLYAEQDALEKDTKVFRYGKVMNKKARYNLCFSPTSQEPDYEHGKGRVIAFSDVPLLDCVRQNLHIVIGEKAKDLMVEANYYYDVAKCYIGYHGDAERRKVIGVRLGESFKFHYQWYLRSKPVGKRLELTLNHGDLYIMSEKAVGTDWKKKVMPTLRHAAGSAKILKLDKDDVVVTTLN